MAIVFQSPLHTPFDAPLSGAIAGVVVAEDRARRSGARS